MRTKRVLSRILIPSTLLCFVGLGSGCAHTEIPVPPPQPGVVADQPVAKGISFNKVIELLRTRPYDPKQLPVRTTPLADIKNPALLHDSGRTLDSTEDILPPFKRLLHPNGVCLAGEWIIERNNPYSGVYRPGSRCPIVARISPTVDAVTMRKGHANSIGLVGKIFPSHDPNEPVATANFITQTDIGGIIAERSTLLFSGLTLSNAPNVTAIRRGAGAIALGVQSRVLAKVDKRTTERQLYPLAEVNMSTTPPYTPAYMKITLDPALESLGNKNPKDLRFELWEAVQKEPLIYNITLSNRGYTSGPIFYRRAHIRWDEQPVGKLVFNQAFLSAPCDDQIHFRHPPWREQINDPSSTVRLKRGTGFAKPLGTP
jgi:hypothetical protein